MTREVVLTGGRVAEGHAERLRRDAQWFTAHRDLFAAAIG